MELFIFCISSTSFWSDWVIFDVRAQFQENTLTYFTAHENIQRIKEYLEDQEIDPTAEEISEDLNLDYVETQNLLKLIQRDQAAFQPHPGY